MRPSLKSMFNGNRPIVILDTQSLYTFFRQFVPAFKLDGEIIQRQTPCFDLVNILVETERLGFDWTDSIYSSPIRWQARTIYSKQTIKLSFRHPQLTQIKVWKNQKIKNGGFDSLNEEVLYTYKAASSTQCSAIQRFFF